MPRFSKNGSMGPGKEEQQQPQIIPSTWNVKVLPGPELSTLMSFNMTAHSTNSKQSSTSFIYNKLYCIYQYLF